VYRENIGAALEQGIEASPVATAIRDLLHDVTAGDVSGKWSGSPKQLLDVLATYAGEVVHTKKWPNSAKRLGDQLTRDQPTLQAVGIEMKRGKSNGNRFVRLRRTDSEVLAP